MKLRPGSSDWTVPQFFKSALFPLIVIVILVYIATLIWGGGDG